MYYAGQHVKSSMVTLALDLTMRHVAPRAADKLFAL